MKDKEWSVPLAPGSISVRLYPHDLPAVDQLEVIRAQATMAAEVGFDGVMVSEHHADFPGYLPNPVQLAGFLAERMSQGWVAPCPLLLPLKPYALIVEDLAWLEAAYPGRVGAGFAAGALPVDFELAEVPFEEIVARFKEALPKTVDALRGKDETPLGVDRAVKRLAEAPMPMCAATQSVAAVRRAARLDLGVLFDSLQTAEVSKKLADVYDEAGGGQAKILIRRVWIGDPPTSEMAAQMDHYRSYAPDQAIANWGDGDQLIVGSTPAEAAGALRQMLVDSNCDTVNVRIHIKGLPPELVNEQMELYPEFLAEFRSS